MSRVMPPHPTKGSPEAMAWAEKMRAARAKKKMEVRSAGLRTEKKFFGPRGVFARAGHTKHFPNPGAEWAKEIANSLNLHLPTPYRHAYTSVLGGPERASVLLTVSLDAKESWPYNILENSRYAKFHIHGNAVELISKSYKLPKFRKSRFKDTQALFDILQAWIRSAAQANPGERWHKGMEAVAGRYARGTHGEEKAMFTGMEVAHRDSATAARRLGMNPQKHTSFKQWLTKHYGLAWHLYQALPTKQQSKVIDSFLAWERKHIRHKKNPLAVFGLGNPPKRINAAIEGVVYSRCLEIRGEKTHYKPGLYKHPFSRNSGVQILALDNGDLLVHSTRGVNLWEPV